MSVGKNRQNRPFSTMTSLRTRVFKGVCYLEFTKFAYDDVDRDKKRSLDTKPAATRL